MIDFTIIKTAALAQADRLITSWIPGGTFTGDEYTARNPTRNDQNAGSFKVNRRSFKWADFATGDRGGDAISLYAFLYGGMGQGEAARALAAELGLSLNGGCGDSKPSLTIEELAAAESLPLDFLKKHGVLQSGRFVKFTCYERDGTPAPRYRLRQALSGKSKYIWNKHPEKRAVGIYGLETLHLFPAPVLHLVEGESDRLTRSFMAATAWAFRGPRWQGRSRPRTWPGSMRFSSTRNLTTAARRFARVWSGALSNSTSVAWSR